MTILSVKDVKAFWADAPKEGFHVIANIDVPFKAEGAIHLQATVRILFLSLGTLKVALQFH